MNTMVVNANKGSMEIDMRFVKMQGLGNDYIFVDCFQEHIQNPEMLSVSMCRAHYGIGADGLILIMPSECADCRMIMYNADGSRGEMCGNGIRCIGKYMAEHYCGKDEREPEQAVQDRRLRIETDAGIRELTCHYDTSASGSGRIVNSVTVDMGVPKFSLEEVGVNIQEVSRCAVRWKDIWYSKLHLPATKEWDALDIIPVSVGNPHAVSFWKEAWPDVEKLGPWLEKQPCFRNRTNAEFVKVVDRSSIELRVWERGSQETLACGTGACAAVAACVLEGLTDRNVLVRLPGGHLHIQWQEDMRIWMTGPAVMVYEGNMLMD